MSKQFLMTFAILLSATSVGRPEDPMFSRLNIKDLPSQAAPDLKGGIVFPGGAIDLSSAPVAMILGDVDGIQGARFLNVRLAFRGQYTDPMTKVTGYLYHLKGEKYDRYFFVSRESVPGAAPNVRYVIVYTTAGEPLAYFRGGFAERP